jgi:hypothetical protein
METTMQKATDMGAMGYLVKASLSLQQLGDQVMAFLEQIDKK